MRSDCPLNFGLEIFGDKWTLLIIRGLMFFGKRYYNGFLASAEGISTNILANRLAMLEQENFIKKNKDEAHKQKLICKLQPDRFLNLIVAFQSVYNYLFIQYLINYPMFQVNPS